MATASDHDLQFKAGFSLTGAAIEFAEWWHKPESASESNQSLSLHLANRVNLGNAWGMYPPSIYPTYLGAHEEDEGGRQRR
ncbi:MAG: hypothetical protein WCI02_03515 [Planctomycetota bacterium]